jgi:hypothetical protein
VCFMLYINFCMEPTQPIPVELKIDAGRLLFGLSRIGYTTSAALCDIIDNSIRANATEITLLLKKEREDYSDSKQNNVSAYTIVDNGSGMSRQGILDALALGASEMDYGQNSLSKFGLGLKTAALSQADILEIISSQIETPGNFSKFSISLPNTIETKEYNAVPETLSNEDGDIIKEFLPGGYGTIVRLQSVRKVNHPSVRSTFNELKLKLGVIYYYYLSGEIKDKTPVTIKIGGFGIDAIDPLFTAKAEGNLNENDWDGKSVQWIEKPKDILLDKDNNVHCTIEITQLPYPPAFKFGDPKETDASIRAKYLISAGNYGFYVYRNHRLISWASSLQGIIVQDQDNYAFRGRILIEDSADDYFNIDVKKSNIILSEDAWNKINDFTSNARYKSKKAWKTAGSKVSKILTKASSEVSNTIASELDAIDLLPGDVAPEERVALERLQEIDRDMSNKVKTMALLLLQDSGVDVDETNTGAVTELSPDEKKEAVRGGKDNAFASTIFRVGSIEDNLLWEPYTDTDLGDCVRINRMHRFAVLIYDRNKENDGLQIIFDLMLLQLAQAELYAYKNMDDYKYDEVRSVLTEFRRVASEFLANLCRRKESVLPPNNQTGVI